MLGGIDVARVYIVCGYTDMRRSIDGLAAIIKQNFGCSTKKTSCFQIPPEEHKQVHYASV